MYRGEERKRNSLRKGGITAQSNPLITLMKGILTALQTDPRVTAILARKCHDSQKPQNQSHELLVALFLSFLVGK